MDRDVARPDEDESEDYSPDPLAETSLDFLFGHPAINLALQEQVRTRLGRDCQGEEDEEWWETLTESMTDLLQRMTNLNSIDMVKKNLH